jgi:NAD+ synthase
MTKPKFSKDLLRIDPEKEVEKISRVLREQLGKILKKRGLVVALSGGIDSSVTLGLTVRAVGPKRVIALMMPERYSAQETLGLSELVADHFGSEKVIEDISGILKSVGHYQRYNDAVRKVIPEYGDDWKSKIVTSIADKKGLNFFYIIAESPDNMMIKERLPHGPYLEIVAATNFKQRTRKMLEYYHADRLNYAVCGTPNRLEYDQGFFVKQGDGAADIKPIAHLYKTQVYKLAEYLDIPDEIIKRPPTTDTYSLPQGQDEFYFAVPYDKMDLCLFGKNNGYRPGEVADAAGLSPDQVQYIYDDIDQKRSTTRYLHLPALLIEDVNEIK